MTKPSWHGDTLLRLWYNQKANLEGVDYTQLNNPQYKPHFWCSAGTFMWLRLGSALGGCRVALASHLVLLLLLRTGWPLLNCYLYLAKYPGNFCGFPGTLILPPLFGKFTVTTEFFMEFLRMRCWWLKFLSLSKAFGWVCGAF